MNGKVLEIFEDYYSGMALDTIRRKHHKSQKTIELYIEKYNFVQMAADRSNAILASTEKELTAARLDVIQAVRLSFRRKSTQKDVFGNDVVQGIPLESSKDLKALTDCITALDGTGFQSPVVVNVGDQVETVNVSDDVLREIGRKLATDNETEE